MINTNTINMPCYTTREFVNFGLHKPNELYNYLFTIQDKKLLINGAIKLFPECMCDFYVDSHLVLQGKTYKKNEKIDVSNIDKKTLEILLKTGMIVCCLSEEYKNLAPEELIKKAKNYELIGKTAKQVSSELKIDFDAVKNILDLKQGAPKKKLNKEHIDKIIESLN